MNHFPQAWGRPRDDVYGPYDHSFLEQSNPVSHTQSPAVTGTSVIGVKFKDGVVLAADNLASYGSLARFPGIKRLHTFPPHTLLGFGGDVSDMQYIDRLLMSLSIRENYSSTDPSAQHTLSAQNLHTYLSKLLYSRRSKFNPLWNSILVGGFNSSGEPFLSSVDLLGTTFSSPTMASGFGAHLAQPLLRRLVEGDEAKGNAEEGWKNVTREQAVEAVKECLKVLWYRDARSSERYSIAVVTKEGGLEVKEDERLEGQKWAFAEGIRGYGTQVN
ncbi:MAG: hypothetical protein Q9227_006043 [Pyrenula ochraceoflavens]